MEAVLVQGCGFDSVSYRPSRCIVYSTVSRRPVYRPSMHPLDTRQNKKIYLLLSYTEKKVLWICWTLTGLKQARFSRTGLLVNFLLSLIVSTVMPTRSYHLSTARMWTRHYLTQTFSPTCLWELWFELWGLQTCWDQILDQGEILGQGRNFGLGWIFDQL